MAFIQMNLFSQSLMRTVPVNVILPADKMSKPGEESGGNGFYKTLYLLHGVFGNYMDWVSCSRIQRYAEEYDLAIVMPSGDNAFYVDQPAGNNFYGTFVGKELVELTRKIFPLSQAREDTFIGGLSMGGYGALRNGLKYHETFGYIVALSSALFVEEFSKRDNGSIRFIERREYGEFCFGDVDKLPESDMSPEYLIKELNKSKVTLPKIYMACGDKDSLLPYNRDFFLFAKENGADVTFEEGIGGHNWDFWDAYIKKGIEWLPTAKGWLGVSSGNVGI